MKNVDLNLSYTLPCEGCSKCFIKPEEKAVTKPINAKWWGAFVPRVPNSEGRFNFNKSIIKIIKLRLLLQIYTRLTVKQDSVDYSQVLNQECGKFNVLTS